MMLSLTLHGGGNSAVALGFARRAIAVASLAAEAHHNAGVILTALGRLDEALPCFHQAIVLAPSHLPERPVPHWRACRGRAESGTVELDLGFTVDAAYAHAASPIPPRLSPLGR
ncbi:tetratricopeptide repeat protein [Azospirillum soli]|uniref:tetratricopeptide repeat protein n=1 Tax=Azospirillum soli TaxID=1304799 RepID=UPI001AE175AD|nr:tetratricopeptide repeat protein [Azospirillum soli]MBP2316575.1 tetratricopeptide (TPR) repeat protein [Azospirillum soli]